MTAQQEQFEKAAAAMLERFGADARVFDIGWDRFESVALALHTTPDQLRLHWDAALGEACLEDALMHLRIVSF